MQKDPCFPSNPYQSTYHRWATLLLHPLLPQAAPALMLHTSCLISPSSSSSFSPTQTRCLRLHKSQLSILQQQPGRKSILRHRWPFRLAGGLGTLTQFTAPMGSQTGGVSAKSPGIWGFMHPTGFLVPAFDAAIMRYHSGTREGQITAWAEHAWFCKHNLCWLWHFFSDFWHVRFGEKYWREMEGWGLGPVMLYLGNSNQLQIAAITQSDAS